MKPEVKYRLCLNTPRPGIAARLVGLTGHPRQHTGELAGDYVNTSEVVSYDPTTGRIETLNTIYVKE